MTENPFSGVKIRSSLALVELLQIPALPGWYGEAAEPDAAYRSAGPLPCLGPVTVPDDPRQEAGATCPTRRLAGQPPHRTPLPRSRCGQVRENLSLRVTFPRAAISPVTAWIGPQAGNDQA